MGPNGRVGPRRDLSRGPVLRFPPLVRHAARGGPPSCGVYESGPALSWEVRWGRQRRSHSWPVVMDDGSEYLDEESLDVTGARLPSPSGTAVPCEVTQGEGVVGAYAIPTAVGSAPTSAGEVRALTRSSNGESSGSSKRQAGPASGRSSSRSPAPSAGTTATVSRRLATAVLGSAGSSRRGGSTGRRGGAPALLRSARLAVKSSSAVAPAVAGGGSVSDGGRWSQSGASPGPSPVAEDLAVTDGESSGGVAGPGGAGPGSSRVVTVRGAGTHSRPPVPVVAGPPSGGRGPVARGAPLRPPPPRDVERARASAWAAVRVAQAVPAAERPLAAVVATRGVTSESSSVVVAGTPRDVEGGGGDLHSVPRYPGCC